MITCRSLFTVLLLLILISQALSASEEKFGANFLQQLTSAEADGVGESLAAYPIGIRSLNNNPAGLAYMEESEFLLSTHELPRITAVIMKVNNDGEWEDYARYDIEPTEMGLISYALPLSRFGKLGIGFVFHHAGRFIRVDEEGKAVNSFPKDDLAFTIGYSLKIRGVSVGVDVENIRSKVPVDDSGNIGRTNAVNVGLMHQMGKRVRVGAVLQNIGGELSFNSPDIPSKLRKKWLVGAVYTVKDSENSVLSLSMDVNPPFEDGLRYGLGAELLYAKRIALRIGYLRDNRVYYELLSNLQDGSAAFDNRVWIREGITVGLGLRLGSVELDIARTPRREPVLNGDEKSRLEKHDSIVSFSCSTTF
ncbi:hypothetical protein ACFL6S_13480 [Candidatus Poribacteria bacterium]